MFERSWTSSGVKVISVSMSFPKNAGQNCYSILLDQLCYQQTATANVFDQHEMLFINIRTTVVDVWNGGSNVHRYEGNQRYSILFPQNAGQISCSNILDH